MASMFSYHSHSDSISGGLTSSRSFCKISSFDCESLSAAADVIVVAIGIKSSTIGGRENPPGCNGRG